MSHKRDLYHPEKSPESPIKETYKTRKRAPLTRDDAGANAAARGGGRGDLGSVCRAVCAARVSAPAARDVEAVRVPGAGPSTLGPTQTKP